MRKFRKWFTLTSIICFGLLGGRIPVFAQDVYSSYIMIDMAATTQRQTVYMYNQGRLETEMRPDGSMLQYTYDANGNLLKRSRGYSSEPYLFSTTARSYDVFLRSVPESIHKVEFPTWTAQDGQDDIEWITGEKIGNGVWKATIVYNRHGGQTGTYITHVYADDRNVGGVSAQVQNSQKITAPQEASLADGYYEVSVEGIARTVQEVRFPSWTANNDQDDLENPWIIGEKVDDTTWRIRVPFSKHNFELGNYITHIYSWDKYGNMGGIGGAAVNVKGGSGGSVDTGLSGVSYDVFMYGVDSQVQHVYFPTWTANQDQDDLEWIQGVKVANGVWKGTVVYSRHNSELGRYHTHIYADGQYVGAWTFDVSNNISVQAPAVAYTNSGFYDITLEGIPSSVTEILFPTWTVANGQDDLENPWLKGERISPSSWRVRIPFYKHNNEEGSYITHIYAYDAYGNSRMIREVLVEVRK